MEHEIREVRVHTLRSKAGCLFLCVGERLALVYLVAIGYDCGTPIGARGLFADTPQRVPGV